jgi:hypothetical protein
MEIVFILEQVIKSRLEPVKLFFILLDFIIFRIIISYFFGIEMGLLRFLEQVIKSR